MGNHFRTSGAGDDAPKTQTGVQGSRFATPDSEASLLLRPPLSRQIRHSRHPILCLQSHQRCRAFRHGGF